MTVQVIGMKSLALVAAALLVFVASANAMEPALKAGDAAPELKVGKWLKGEAVAKFEPGKIYVLEFWATWCGPCIAAMPMLSELQQKYPDVVFVGVNCWERDAAKIGPFMAKSGSRMAYRVAQDDLSGGQPGAMAKSWMNAAGRDGIPATFVVGPDRKIAWIGHPDDLGDVLAAIKGGTFDRQAEMKRQDRAKALQVNLDAALDANRIDEALTIMDQLAVAQPKSADRLRSYRFYTLMRCGRWPEAKTLARTSMAEMKDGESLWNMAGFVNSDLPKRWKPTDEDLDLGIQLAERATELDREHLYYTYPDLSASLLARRGKWEEAVNKQAWAVTLAEQLHEPDPELVAGLKKVASLYAQKRLTPSVRLVDAERDGKTEELRAVFAEMNAADPAGRPLRDVSLVRYELKHDERASAHQRVEAVLREAKDAKTLNSLAWALATVGKPDTSDIELGIRVSERSNQLAETPTASYLDTLARLKALAGRWEEAVAAEEKAVALATGGSAAEMTNALKAYRERRIP